MILVTGANGQLATLILQSLAERGAAATGGTRTPDGEQRYVDFDAPDSLDFNGVTTLVLVSAGYAEDDRVIARHRAAIDAAIRDGVGHVVYTSVTTSGDHLGFTLAHRATERMLRSSGLSWTILRNGLYAELFGAMLMWGPDGIESAFGSGALAAPTRNDLAAVAAVVAMQPSAHVGSTYELVGDLITANDVAAALHATHHSITMEEYRQRLLSDARLLPFQPPMIASIATAVRHDFLSAQTSDLTRLLDRPAEDSLSAAALAARATSAAVEHSQGGRLTEEPVVS
ncbi:NAD(P)H-binding protein [Microbacterium sp. NPDC076768]|uniref:NAD(P)H-binding protein n=1 Tax=Microbacterium sp. NPDC076768 TaxID=3154858 RepID=UPI003444C80C